MTESGFSVRANIRLLSTSESGRMVPIQNSYRPNHNFFGPDNREMAIGIINFPPGVALYPGESIDMEMTFLPWERLEGEIYPGRQWRIQEAMWLVGIGTILSVERPSKE